jgi:hypothetical protein
VAQLLVVDGQVFQTPAWHRGMGKYSLQLLTALSVAGPDAPALQLVLSNHAPADDQMLDAVRRAVPAARIAALDLLPDQPDYAGVLAHNRGVLDAHLAAQQRAGGQVDFLQLSTMQGLIRPTFPERAGVRTAALVYDLIPLMFHDTYLQMAEARAEYLPRIAELLRADLFLTISRTVANDLAGYLGVDPARIANIDGGAIQHSRVARSVDRVASPFVLMPTGNDMRKNNRRGIRAFDRFNRGRGGTFRLVITSSFRPDEVATLSALAPGVVFTGNLDGAELDDLYRRASALLFPPEYEGLGLPILEAIEHGKPVACSDIAVFREISDSAFHFFDPRSILDMADAIGAAVDQDGIDERSYATVLQRYTWPRVAQRFLQVAASRPAPADRAGSEPLDVVVIGPDPGVDDAAGRPMQELHPELSRLARLSYVLQQCPDTAPKRAAYLDQTAGSVPFGAGLDLGRHDVALYHLANSRACAGALFIALAEPGVLILHDTELDQPWAELVRRGLVSASRAGLERRLQARLGVAGTSHLAALLARQHVAVVATALARDRVAAVAALTNPGLRIEIVPAAVPTVRYGHALPAKTTLIAPTAGTNWNHDLRATEATSRAQFAVFAPTAAVHDVLRAMRFGVVPVLQSDPAALDLPAELCVELAGRSVQAAISPLLADPRALAELSGRVRRHTETAHGERGYAERLCQLLREVCSGAGSRPVSAAGGPGPGGPARQP